MLNYEFPPLGGGAANACCYLLKELAEKTSHEVDLVTSSVDEFKIDNFSDNISVHYLDINKKENFHYQTNKNLLSYSLKAFRYSKKLIKKKKYDLIHAFFGIPCGFIAMKLKLPYVVSLRGSDVPFYNERFKNLDRLLFKRLSKKIWRKAKAVVCNSEGLKELALKSSPLQKISVIYNGVDIHEFKPLEKKYVNDKYIVISTGRLIQRKGFKYLLEALSEVSGFKLQLIGDGDLKEELRKLSVQLEVEVDFLGTVEHSRVVSYLQKADVFVLPSLNEGMSNSVLEAMACALPIITTDVGGSKELIKDNGMIVNKGSSEEIREALLTYKGNKELLSTHSKESRERALNMSWQTASDKYCRIYSLIKF